MNIDLVPESSVDETITDIQGLFVNYMHNRSISNLEALMSTIRKMLSELYHTCTWEKKKYLLSTYLIYKISCIQHQYNMYYIG